MNVLILHMRYYPDPTGTGLILTQLAEDLARYGAQVTVIAGHPHYARMQTARGKRQHLLTKETRNGVAIWRTYTYVPPSPSIFQRALSYLSFTLLSTFAALAAPHANVILWMTPPITTGLTAWVASLFHRAPVVFDLQDIWPDQVVRVGKLKNRLIIRGAEALERFLYRQAKGIRALSAGMRAALLAKGVPGQKIATIPNWVDPDEIAPGPCNNAFRLSHSLDEHFVILFSGNIGYVAGLETVLEAAGLLCDTPDVLFLMVGEGNAKADLQTQARAMNLTNVRFLATQPRERLAEMIAAADVALVPLRKGLNGISVPSKMYTMMAAGRPVLAVDEPESDLARLVEVSGCGVCVAPGGPTALAAAIRAIRQDAGQLKEMGRRAREYVTIHYRQSHLTRQYLDWLVELAGMARNPATVAQVP